MTDVRTPDLKSIQARWVWFRARAYRRAVDTRGLVPVLCRLHVQDCLLRAVVIGGLGFALSASLVAGQALASTWGALGVIAGWALLAGSPLATRWACAWGWVRLTRPAREDIHQALAQMDSGLEPSGKFTVHDASRWLWTAELVYLLVDPEGRARMAERDLATALSHASAPDAPRSRM